MAEFVQSEIRYIKPGEEVEIKNTALIKDNGCKKYRQECLDCINAGGDWECDRIHCRKGGENYDDKTIW